MRYLVLQQAINYLIDTGGVDVEPLSGKNIRFSLKDIPIDVNFVCTNNRIFVLSNTDKAADVDIKLKSSAFISLIQGKDFNELIEQDKIIVHGDVKTAQLLVSLLNNTDIDLEEELSKYTGDIVANKAASLVSKLNRHIDKSTKPFDKMKDGLMRLLINPSKSEQFNNKRR